MHEPLEAYLKQVKAQLKSLPRGARENEINEIRLHLQAIINESVKRGASEADAVNLALTQFGDSQEVGRDLKNAWDEQPESWLRAFGAGICVAICNAVLIYASVMLFALTDAYVFRGNESWNGPNVSLKMRAAQGILIASLCLSPTIAGWIGQKIAPKRAILSIVPIYLAMAFLAWQLLVPDITLYLLVLFCLPLVCIGAWSRKWWMKKRAVRVVQQ